MDMLVDTSIPCTSLNNGLLSIADSTVSYSLLPTGQAAPVRLAEDAARLVMDLAAGSLLELLTLALVDQQFLRFAQARFAHELHWFGADPHAEIACPRLLLSPQVARQFVVLPGLPLSSPGVTSGRCRDDSCAAFAHFADDEALLHCQRCSTPIVKAGDIISHNYRVMTGRAYLTAAAYNVTIAEKSHEAQQFRVKHVACAKCELRFGITYIGSADPRHRDKVGNFLIGQHLLVRPSCCLLRARPHSGDLPTPLCRRCSRSAAHGALKLVQLMTGNLSMQGIFELQELLVRQRANEAAAEPGMPSARGWLLAPPSALVAWRVPLNRRRQVWLPAALETPVVHTPPLAPPQPLPQPDEWQAILRARVAMLASMQPSMHQRGARLHDVLTAIVRFAGAVWRLAWQGAPIGATPPGRAALLLELLPTLIRTGCRDAIQAVRGLVIAVRREWIVGVLPGSSGSTRSVIDAASALTMAEIEAIVNGISARAAEVITFRSEVDCVSEDEGVVAEDDPWLLCLCCGTPVLRTSDIASSQYHIMTGPAYLANAAQNLDVAEVSYESVYMSGRYTVRDVACMRCNMRLGVTYENAVDESNRYKVGKFLLGQLPLLGATDSTVPLDEAELRSQLFSLICGSPPSDTPRQLALAPAVVPRRAASRALTPQGDEGDGRPNEARTATRVVRVVGTPGAEHVSAATELPESPPVFAPRLPRGVGLDGEVSIPEAERRADPDSVTVRFQAPG